MILLLFTNDNAPVAELADAQRSGRCMGFHVQVRILFGALEILKNVDTSTLKRACMYIYCTSSSFSSAPGMGIS